MYMKVPLMRNSEGLVGVQFFPSEQGHYIIGGLTPGGPAAGSREIAVGDKLYAVGFKGIAGKPMEQVYTHTHAHTHTHTHTHIHKHTHTQTHTHMHACMHVFV